MLVDWQIWGVTHQHNRAATSAMWLGSQLSWGRSTDNSRTAGRLLSEARRCSFGLRCAYSQDRVAAWQDCCGSARLHGKGLAASKDPTLIPFEVCQDHKLQAVSPSFLSPSLRCFISVVARPPCLLANQGEVACGKDSACGLVVWFMVISGARASKPSIQWILTHTSASLALISM